MMLYMPNANCATPSERIVPWYANCHSGKNIYSGQDHQKKHDHKKRKESVTKPGGRQKTRRRFLPGEFELVPEQIKQLPAPAVPVAEKFVSSEYSNCEGKEKLDHSEPCKQNVEQPQDQINRGVDPKIIVPVFTFLHVRFPFLFFQ